jgi:quercetin dioxygenase-like cupin family protein
MYQFIVTTLAILLTGTVAQAQGSVAHPAGQNMAEMKFEAVPGIPSCSTAAVQSGNPGTGPSVLLVKAATGCTVPWHWHTPTEHLMIVMGVAHLDMKDAKPLTLRAGGYAMMPSKHIHQFHCNNSCVFYVYSDGIFDTHYVDGNGKEIPPDQALKTGK